MYINSFININKNSEYLLYTHMNLIKKYNLYRCDVINIIRA